MKKLFLLLFIANFIIIPMFFFKAHAATDNDYLSYIEIVMSTGKLIRNYTSEEFQELKRKTEKPSMFGVEVAKDCQGVPATYISSILVSYENAGTSDIEFTKTVVIETNLKMSFSTSGSLSGSLSGNIKKIKAQIAAKADMDFKASYEKSIKEKKEVKVKVEANSKMILYITGDLTVNNGVFSSYIFYVRELTMPYEFVRLNTQYERLEKAKIDEDLII